MSEEKSIQAAAVSEEWQEAQDRTTAREAAIDAITAPSGEAGFVDSITAPAGKAPTNVVV